MAGEWRRIARELKKSPSFGGGRVLLAHYHTGVEARNAKWGVLSKAKFGGLKFVQRDGSPGLPAWGYFRLPPPLLHPSLLKKGNKVLKF